MLAKKVVLQDWMWHLDIKITNPVGDQSSGSVFFNVFYASAIECFYLPYLLMMAATTAHLAKCQDFQPWGRWFDSGMIMTPWKTVWKNRFFLFFLLGFFVVFLNYDTMIYCLNSIYPNTEYFMNVYLAGVHLETIISNDAVVFLFRETNPTGWWMSEKLDGVRAYWNGKCFYSRLGNAFYAPSWFTKVTTD